MRWLAHEELVLDEPIPELHHAGGNVVVVVVVKIGDELATDHDTKRAALSKGHESHRQSPSASRSRRRVCVCLWMVVVLASQARGKKKGECGGPAATLTIHVTRHVDRLRIPKQLASRCVAGADHHLCSMRM